MEPNVSHDVLQAWKSGLDSILINFVEIVQETSLACLNNYLDGTLMILKDSYPWISLVKSFPDKSLKDFELNEDLALVANCLMIKIAESMEHFAKSNNLNYFFVEQISYGGFIAKSFLEMQKITNWVYYSFNTDVITINHENIPDQLLLIAESVELKERMTKTMNFLVENYKEEEYYDEENEELKEVYQEEVLREMEKWENQKDSYMDKQCEKSYLNYNVQMNCQEIDEMVIEAIQQIGENTINERSFKQKENKVRWNKEKWKKNFWLQNKYIKTKQESCQINLNQNLNEIPKDTKNLATKSILKNSKILFQRYLNQNKWLEINLEILGNNDCLNDLKGKTENWILNEKEMKAKDLCWKTPWCIKNNEVMKFLNLKNKWKSKKILTLMKISYHENG